MAHQESCSIFFLPESAFPAKKIPPDFTVYGERELGHACLKYSLAEKVYLNPLFKTCTSFITWISSTTQAGKHFCTSVLHLVSPGRETLLTCQINTEIRKADVAFPVDFTGPTSSAGTWGSTQGDVTLSLRGGRRKLAWLSPHPLPGKSVSIQGHWSCLYALTKFGQTGNPHGW